MNITPKLSSIYTITAILGWMYILLAVIFPNFIFSDSSFYWRFFYLLGAPLLLLTLINFSHLWSLKLIGSFFWVPTAFGLTAIWKGIGGLFGLLGHPLTKKSIKTLTKREKNREETQAEGHHTQNETEIIDTKDLAKDNQCGEPENSAEAHIVKSEAPQESATEWIDRQFLKFRPRFWVQLSSLLVFSFGIVLWTIPVFAPEGFLSSYRSLLILVYVFFFFCGTAIIEYSYRDFAFWRTTLGLYFTPFYWLSFISYKLLFKGPEGTNKKDVFALKQKLARFYYPAVLFPLFNRGYLTWLVFIFASIVISLLTGEARVFVGILIALAIMTEYIRLVYQLVYVKYLGVVDFKELDEIARHEENENKKPDISQEAVKYAVVSLAKRTLSATGNEQSYLYSLGLLLVKHMLMIGGYLCIGRYLYLDSNGITPELHELIANSFTLLFGEIAFPNECGSQDCSLPLLPWINLVGVASSFILLGLALSYLSGASREAYFTKAERLKIYIEEYDTSASYLRLKLWIEAQGESLENIGLGTLLSWTMKLQTAAKK